MSDGDKKSRGGLIIRIVVVLVLGGAAIFWKLQKRNEAIEHNRAVKEAEAAAIREQEQPEPAAPQEQFQKTSEMLEAERLAEEIDRMEQEIAAARTRIDEMNAWLANYEANELTRLRESGDAQQIAEAEKLFAERTAHRDALARQTDAAHEDFMRRKVELTNKRMDIIIGD